MPRKKRMADDTLEASQAHKSKRGSRKPAVGAGEDGTTDDTPEASKAPKPKRGSRRLAVDAGENRTANSAPEAVNAPKATRGGRKAAVDAGEKNTRSIPAGDVAAAAASRPECVVQHYLLKSEPHEFSIDNLEAAQGSTEPWDGVRNYQARNIMRGMRTGDLCFYYHSNCKEPGIVGIAEVVKEAYPDSTALDTDSSKHDPKSTPEDPRWYMVDVKLVRKLSRLVSLRELKEHEKGELHGMALLTHGRLSVQPVSLQHWEFVLSLERQEAA